MTRKAYQDDQPYLDAIAIFAVANVLTKLILIFLAHLKFEYE